MLVKLKMENMKHSIVHKNNILAHPDHSSWAGRFPVTDKKVFNKRQEQEFELVQTGQREMVGDRVSLMGWTGRE